MTNKGLLEELVCIASGQVGAKEEGGNNKGPEIVKYQKATWLEPGAWAWCAALQCWILKKWLENQDVLDALKLTPKSAEVWRCQDASAFGWEKWARAKGLTVIPETGKAELGDFVIFDFSHIGIVRLDQEGEYIQTIEGNTNNKGQRDSESGDGVWMKTRHAVPDMITCYIRILPT